MIQVKQSNVKFKYNDSGNIKYSPLLDLLIVDHQSEYIDQAKNRIQEIVNQINNNSSVINNFCDGYAPQKNYNIGDYVFYDGELYCCIKTIQNSGETFPENSFKKCTVGDQLLKIKNIQLDRIKKILQCEDSEEIVLDPEEDFFSGVYIEASSGIEKSNSNYYATSFIDIKDSLKLLYTRGVSSGSSPTVGMAFYDNNKIFIPESGQIILPSGSSATQEQIFVPINACYARFSNRLAGSASINNFKLIKINKISNEIMKVLKNISSQYSKQKTYNIDDYCLYNDKLYKCKNEVTNSTWNENDWQEANLVDYINSLKNRISSLNANEISYDPFNLNYESGTVGHKLTETINTVSNISNNIYNITENLNNDNNRLSNLQQNKFDNPTNNDSGTVNQVLIKTENGSAWSNNLQLVNETINGLESNKINKPGSSVSNGSILMKTQNGVEWESVPNSLDITTTVEDWLEDNISTPQNVVIDNTLTISNAVAEAQATGNLIIAGTQQPTQESNKIWINQGNNVEEVQISTYEDLTNIVANQYSNKAYKNGEYFINEGILYRVTADISAANNINIEAVSKTQVTVGAEISDLKSATKIVAEGEIPIDPTEYNILNVTINASKAVTKNGTKYRSAQIPVTAGIYKSVTFTANSEKSGVITFLKTEIPSTITNNTSVTEYFAAGETDRHLVEAGATATFNVPADAKYFFVSVLSNDVNVAPAELTAMIGIASKINKVKDDAAEADEMLSDAMDILAPYARTAEYMRADGTLSATTAKRLYKYKITHNVLDSILYLSGKGTLSGNANPYCYLWFVQNGTMMQDQYIPVLVNPTYFDMMAITVPTGAEEVWVDRTMKVFTRKQTASCMNRLSGIERIMASDTITDPMSLAFTVTTKMYVQYGDGRVCDNSNFSVTDYVPVGGYKTLTYGRVALTDSGETSIGMAFYDKDLKYISGQTAITGAESLSHVATNINVPSGACFARFSTHRYVTGFSISGTSGFVQAIAVAARQADAVGTQWRGKNWYAYGTSLTAETQGRYANHVAQMSGMNLTNRGYGGGGMVTNPQIYNRLKDMTDGKLDADLITIECGANDGSAPIGDPTSMDTTTICGALNDAIKYMFDNGIKAQVVLMCSYPSRYKSGDSSTRFDVTSVRDGGGTWADLCDAIRKVAMANGLYYIAFNGLGMSRARGNGQYGDLYVADNIHPTALGGYNVALGVWYQLRNIPVFYSEMPT